MNQAVKERIEKVEQGIVPEGYKKTGIGIIPEDWEVKKLGQVSKRIAEKNKGKTDNVLTISAQDGLINQEEYFTKQVASKNLENYTYLVKGDFAYNKSYSIGYPMGTIKRLELYEDGVVSSLYICFRAKEHVSVTYLQHYFNGNLFIKEIMKIAQEGARNHGLLNIGISDFFNIKLELPKLKEQEKIAEILSVWDKSIEKIEKLIKQKELQKKGLSQQLLTGETRLSGFSEDWKRVKLGEYLKLQGGYAFKSDNYFTNDGIPIIRISNIQDGIDFNNNLVFYEEIKIDNNFIVNKGDLLIAMSGATTGKTAIYKSNKKAYLNQRVGKFLVAEDKLNTEYLTQIVNTKLFSNKLATRLVAGAQPNISGKDIETLDYSIPPLAEQKAIADILSTADKEIELLNKLLENKKEEKKGLMQLLLTGIARV